MTQKEFARFYKKLMGTKKTYEQAEKDVKGFLAALEEAVTTDVEGKVVFPGFGNFTSKVRPSRKVKHPKTGVEIEIPERKCFAFKASHGLTARIREK